jgi:hypothetical protein
MTYITFANLISSSQYDFGLFLGFQTSFRLIRVMLVHIPLTMDRIHMYLLEIAWLTCMQHLKNVTK